MTATPPAAPAAPPTHPPTAPVAPAAPAKSAQPSMAAVSILFVAVFLAVGYVGSYLAFGSKGNGQKDPVQFVLGIGLLAWMGSLMIPGVRKVTMLPLLMIIGPFFTRGMRMTIAGRFDRLDAIPDSVLPEHAEQIDKYRAALEAEGFVSGGLFLVTEASWARPDGPSGRLLLEPFVHGTRRHTANMMHVLVEQGPLRPAPTLQFCERISSGDEVGVTNNPSPGLFPSLPGVHALQFPGLGDAAELYRIQRAMLQRHAPSHTPPPSRGGEIAAKEDNRRTMERWIGAGWVVPTGDGRYRISGKMLLRTTWGLTPPISDWRVWRKHRLSQRMRREMGV